MSFAVQALGPQRATDLRLEEVESSLVDGRKVWLITLSTPAADGLPGFVIAPQVREYKSFAVAKDTGEVLSMKIRLLTAPAA